VGPRASSHQTVHQDPEVGAEAGMAGRRRRRRLGRRFLIGLGWVGPLGGDEGGGEGDGRGRVDLDEGRAGGRGEVVGVGDAEDRGGLGGAEGAEADPESEVAVEAAQAAFVEALGGEQEMHAQAATDAADGGEHVQELRPDGQQLAELVDHDEEVGQRFESRVGRTARGVGAQVGLVAGQVQEPLAPGQLALEGRHGPVDHRQLGLQVGDEPRHLRERGEGGEGGTALEVDQHERELFGWVGRGQAGDDRSQQLALARTRGTNDQAVWADAALGRLLEVKDERLPGRAGADRHREELSPRTRWQPVAVGTGRAERAGMRGEQVEKPNRSGSRSHRRRAVEPKGRQAASDGLARGEACRVGADAGHLATARNGLQERREALVVDADAHRQLGRLVGGGRGQPDDRDAGRMTTSHRDTHCRDGRLRGDRTRLGRVEDRQQVRAGAGGASGWVAGVREPPHPLPGGASGAWVRGEDLEVVGSVEGGELADQGAGEGARPGRWAGEGQDGELAEGNGHRGVGEPVCSADEVLCRLEELGVVLDEWTAGGLEPGRGGEGDGGAADPCREEVGVAGAAFPEPVGPVDRRPEHRQVGVEVLGAGELGGGQPVGPDRDLL
jgi:hypothetical protein